MKPSRPLIILLLASIFSFEGVFAHSSPVVEVEQQIYHIKLKPVFVFASGVDRRRWWRLIRSVKRVYPLAKVAQEKMRGMEEHLATLESKKEQKAYIREVYQEIKAEYTPVLLKMTYTDGRVLIRLIDRETEYTAYEVLDEFKGGLTASLWQGVGRLFGHNLKDEYGSNIEDQTIEKIIRYYEAGLL